jgi:hypothetical protein
MLTRFKSRWFTTILGTAFVLIAVITAMQYPTDPIVVIRAL